MRYVLYRNGIDRGKVGVNDELERVVRYLVSYINICGNVFMRLKCLDVMKKLYR